MRRAAGFTLIEVLVALALVATVLGGVLGLVRESIATQAYTERRLLATWAASNVLEQYLLEHRALVADQRVGGEDMLGRRFRYRLAVRALPPPPSAGGLRDAAEGPEVTLPARFVLTVEVREGTRSGTPLARLEVEREAREGS